MVIIGRLTKDAVVNQLKDERKVVNFSVAVNDYYKPKGHERGVIVTNYFNCSYWISSAFAERLKKGALVELNGRIGINAYTTLQGDAKASLTFHVNGITIHQVVKDDARSTKKATKKEEAFEPIEDLPF
jgi:single-strand DNA-binding protein